MKTTSTRATAHWLYVVISAWHLTANAQTPLFQTTFDCPDWNQSIGIGDADVCTTGDGISGSGLWTSSNGSTDRITAAANNPSGLGGKGFRHYRGDGNNNGGGGIRITLPQSTTQMWVRFYMRYSLGFQWSYAPDAHPQYTKDLFWNEGTIFGYQGPGWGIYANSTHFTSSLGWYPSQGNSYTGDGKFHCFEYYLQKNGTAGAAALWVDGVQYLNAQSINLGANSWSSFMLGENQAIVVGAGSTDYYTDYDDVVVSTTGRIGCLSSGDSVAPSAPMSLQVQ